MEQPANLGTAPAILYSLIRIAKADPDAYVTFFPSDHYLSDDDEFMRQVDAAFTGIERRPGMIALLGITPGSAETEYGWIEPESGPDVNREGMLMGVKRFWEKPDKKTAGGLFSNGCLWNSFVMVGRVAAFLNLFEKYLPGLAKVFAASAASFGKSSESATARALYAWIAETNFSSEILEKAAVEQAIKISGGEHRVALLR